MHTLLVRPSFEFQVQPPFISSRMCISGRKDLETRQKTLSVSCPLTACVGRGIWQDDHCRYTSCLSVDIDRNGLLLSESVLHESATSCTRRIDLREFTTHAATHTLILSLRQMSHERFGCNSCNPKEGEDFEVENVANMVGRGSFSRSHLPADASSAEDYLPRHASCSTRSAKERNPATVESDIVRSKDSRVWRSDLWARSRAPALARASAIHPTR